MFEKVNCSHPDKLADCIGGAIVDLAYEKEERPRVAGEILLGHGNCHIIIETNVNFTYDEIKKIVRRIAGNVHVDLKLVPQDKHLAKNQEETIKCGDNGIFSGKVSSKEEKKLSGIVRALYAKYPFDGKFIYDAKTDKLIACQSNVDSDELLKDLQLTGIKHITVNPLGDWTGGFDVDSGACNRKLGSDLGRAVTGGGIHFKDISKADVAINVFLHMLAEKYGRDYEAKCAIGDSEVWIENYGLVSYEDITKSALNYIKNVLGGFEKMAEWGLI